MGLDTDPSVLIDEIADVEVGAVVLPVDQIEVIYRAQSGILAALIEPDSTRVGGDDVQIDLESSSEGYDDESK